MPPTRGDIVDYTVTDGSPSVALGALGTEEVVPLLVVSVAEDGKSYSGFAFLPNGAFEYVTFTDAPAPDAKPVYDSQTGVRLDSETPVFDSQTGVKLSEETPKYDPFTDAPIVPPNTEPTQSQPQPGDDNTTQGV
jgi:hypothetical protein